MENSQIEEIINETFSGLTLFYRDVELSDDLVSKYQAGQILLERGFTDMSYKGGGLATNFRYLIASSNARDLSAINPDAAKFGHVILPSGSLFKVLDVYKIGGKAQVFLLQIPAKGVSLFATATTNIEEQIIEKARQGFEEKLNSDPIPELQDESWKSRVDFPLGMDKHGKLFYQPGETGETSSNQGKPWWKFW